MDAKSEHFLLHAMADDRMPITDFDGYVEGLQPEAYSRPSVLHLIRELAESGYLRSGAFGGPGTSWQPWKASLERR
ncbi:hypothetical protein [Nocardia asteroides]|uniref:hypothetical protein n=1 Tax=Nocardia asteroides TaxID=1824 RepID=UPI001E63522B|nr:hypothetical protein [Nocardia asteroides]UGT64186.1 hypothetical protein LTT61_13195 [Nocardia asteroides]